MEELDPLLTQTKLSTTDERRINVNLCKYNIIKKFKKSWLHGHAIILFLSPVGKVFSGIV